jgi:hypothetical protein
MDSLWYVNGQAVYTICAWGFRGDHDTKPEANANVHLLSEKNNINIVHYL